MLDSISISKIMTKKPEVLHAKDTMERARRVFEEHSFHHIPVVEGEKLVGLVSYTDYLRVIRDLFDNSSESRENAKVLQAMLVREVMTERVHCLSENDTLGDALQIFKANQFHALPIVDERQRLLGIVTTYDLMHTLEHLLAPQSSAQ